MIPIIIPSYEPNDNLLGLMDQLNKAKLEPVVIVNDGSSEQYLKYYDIARDKYGAIILNHEVNRGKGQGLRTAFQYCLDTYQNLEGCVTADSDGQHTVEAIGDVKKKLLECPQVLILGVRDFSAEDVPDKSRMGNNLTRKVFRSLYKKDISDTQTGLRGISREFMRVLLDVPGDRFEYETKMLIEAVERGINIVEVPIPTVYDSKENHSTHFRPVVDSYRIYKLFGFAFGKFLLSSLSSSVIDMAFFQLFCILMRDRVSGYIFVSTAAARVISCIYNYMINYHLVFKSQENKGTSAIKYVILAICQAACSAGLTALFNSLCNPSMEVFVKIPVDVALFFASYQIQKRLIFKKK